MDTIRQAAEFGISEDCFLALISRGLKLLIAQHVPPVSIVPAYKMKTLSISAHPKLVNKQSWCAHVVILLIGACTF